MAADWWQNGSLLVRRKYFVNVHKLISLCMTQLKLFLPPWMAQATSSSFHYISHPTSMAIVHENDKGPNGQCAEVQSREYLGCRRVNDQHQAT